MIQFQVHQAEKMDGRTDRPYFIEPFQLPPAVQQE